MKLPGYVKLLLSFLVSGLFLFLIYRKIDFSALADTLKNANRGYFWIYILLFFPQIAVASLRWKYILSKINDYPVSFFHSLQMVVGSYSANLAVPAKMGEMVRVFWVDKTRSKYRPFIIILFEKIWDLLAVYAIAYVSLFFLFRENPRYSMLIGCATLANAMAIILIAIFMAIRAGKDTGLGQRFSKIISAPLDFLIENRGKLPQVAGWSILLWLIQLLQFYYMFLVFDIHLSIPLIFAGGGLGVLAGAVIVSIGGIGPRDAALIWFYAGIVSKEILVSVGIISVFRIVVPALLGLPFFINLSFSRKKWNRPSGKN
jgi:glycosyltransferase 2 family protein